MSFDPITYVTPGATLNPLHPRERTSQVAGSAPMSIPTRIAGWIAFIALILAPWFFGSRPYLWNGLLALTLLTAGLLWVIGLRNERRWPNIPVWCFTSVVALLAFLWTSLLNARSVYDAAHDQFVPVLGYIAFLPSTVDRANSVLTCVSISAMLVALLLFVDLSSFHAWQNRFLRGMAISGITVVVAGLLLKADVLASLHELLQRRPWASGDIFGPFDYHGNAGAFINLSIPAIATQAAAASALTWRAFWLAGLALAAVAALINTSRAGLTLTVISLPIAAWMIVLGWKQTASTTSQIPSVIVGLVFLSFLALAVAFLVTNTGSKSVERLSGLRREISVPWYPRYRQNLAAWDMATEHPWLGSGVGAYRLLVQHSAIRGTFYAPAFRPGQPYTVLGNTHNDYLQTLVEWGVAGLATWAALVIGASGTLLSSLRKASSPQLASIAAGMALITVYVHAIVDCPLQTPSLQLYTVAFLGLALWPAPSSQE